MEKNTMVSVGIAGGIFLLILLGVYLVITPNSGGSVISKQPQQVVETASTTPPQKEREGFAHANRQVRFTYDASLLRVTEDSGAPEDASRVAVLYNAQESPYVELLVNQETVDTTTTLDAYLDRLYNTDTERSRSTKTLGEHTYRVLVLESSDPVAETQAIYVTRIGDEIFYTLDLRIRDALDSATVEKYLLEMDRIAESLQGPAQ